MSGYNLHNALLTVSLNRIMSNSAQHGEPGLLAQSEPLSHPRKEVSKTVMPPLYTLGNPSATASE